MTTIGVTKAQRQMEQLIERALKGETIIISKRGKPVARLMPVNPPVEKTTNAEGNKD